MEIDVQLFMQKKLIYCLFAMILMSASFKGQRHEIGVQLGTSNIVGDIGRTNYFLQRPVVRNIGDYGIPIYANALYRMNFNPYQTLRFNVGYSHVQFIDSLAKEQYRRNRNLWGTNSIYEASLLFEYNFFPVNDEQKGMVSPYIFGGIGGILMNTPRVVVTNDFNRDADGNAVAPTSSTDFETTVQNQTGNKMTMSVPFGVGLKYKFNYNWTLFGELMFRPTFSDAVDYSVSDESDVKITYNKDILVPGGTKSLLQQSPYLEVAQQRAAPYTQSRQIGNINSKDWVNTVSLGLSYSFGRPPCYCDQ